MTGGVVMFAFLIPFALIFINRGKSRVTPMLIHAESNERGIVVEQMLTEVVYRGRKLYSADGSCIVDRKRK
ncbi:hypothetical protein pdam_00015941 [Pocillopora damicornis]|uniref:Uncharacterized protein n=1 Tax=Pocillopora damicornis TaxID=46731 RepID=A0A3M6TH82_POCDA|nr:hypothetical protein pdam_00015941 [Pocillopora damicornis]